MKAIGYCRVSTIEQAHEGVSLAAQEAKIRAYCLANDLDLVEVVTDGGVSGKTTERDGLQAVLEAVERGEAQAVVVLKLDRLSRRVVDTLALIEQIEEAGAGLHSINERIDTKSAFGRFLVTVLAALAEMERNTIAERTSMALRHKQAQGEHVGSIPYGFAMQDGRLVPLEAESAVIGLAIRLRDAGRTLQEIVAEFQSRGIATKRGGSWTPTAIRRLILRAGATAT